MDKLHVETNIKQMVGEFMDCAGLISAAEVVGRSGGEDKETVEFAQTWAAHLTEQAVQMAFDEEVGVHPILALAYLACNIAANASNLMFQAEAFQEVSSDD